jgi:hypothetical protein
MLVSEHGMLLMDAVFPLYSFGPETNRETSNICRIKILG